MLFWLACCRKKRRREEEAKVEEGEAAKTGGEEVQEQGKREEKVDLDAGLTPAQKRHMKKMEERVRSQVLIPDTADSARTWW